MLGTVVLAALMLQASSDLRREYVSCLSSAVASAKGANISVDAFKDYAHKTCASVEGGLKAQMVAFNLKNGMSKKTAAEDAQLQLDDYVYTAEEKYRYSVQPPQ